jgi:hypothetical protein
VQCDRPVTLVGNDGRVLWRERSNLVCSEHKIWRKEIEDKPGTLAATLEPLAAAGANFQVVMGYRYPGAPMKVAVELFPITGNKVKSAAQQAGLSLASMPALLVEGDDRPGLGGVLTKAIAEAGVNLDSLVAQAVGKKFSAVCGFENEEAARKGASAIRKAATASKR